MLGILTCLASDMIKLGRNYFFKFCRRFNLLLLFVFYYYHYHFESRDLYMKKPMTIYKKNNNTFVSWRHYQSHFHSQNDCVFVYFMSCLIKNCTVSAISRSLFSPYESYLMKVICILICLCLINSRILITICRQSRDKQTLLTATCVAHYIFLQISLKP